MAGLMSEVKTFTSSIQLQELDLVWRIEKFEFITAMPRREMNFVFDAGEKFGMDSKWKASLVVGKSPEREIKFYFELIDNGGKPDTPFYAWARISIDKQKKHGPSYADDRVEEDAEEMAQLIVVDDEEDEEVAHLNLVEEEEGGVEDDLVEGLVFELPLHDFDGVKEAAECGSCVTASDLINHYLDNGTLILHIQFDLYGSVVSSVKESRALIDSVNVECTHKNVMLAMLNDGVNADVIFKTKDGQEIKAHKLILCTHSDVLKTMLLDSNMKEKKDGIVELTDIGSDALKIFLKYIYTGDVDDSWGDFYEELINAADKYQVHPLKDAFDRMLIAICTKENCFELAEIANLHNLSTASGNIEKFISDDPALLMKFLRVMFQKIRN